MGATIVDVRTQFLTLWALVLFYGTTAIYLESFRRFRLPRAEGSSARARSSARSEIGPWPPG
jgi:hypothetical protein